MVLEKIAAKKNGDVGGALFVFGNIKCFFFVFFHGELVEQLAYPGCPSIKCWGNNFDL